MSFRQHRPDSTSQSLRVHPVEFRLTQSTKQVVDRLVVDIEHVPRSWSKEVHRLDISFVHRDIPKDLTLSAEEHRHLLTPHLIVFAIEVWRPRTSFIVCHPWILDWLESIKTCNRLWYHLKDRIGDQRGGSEWEPIKILSQTNSAYIPIATLRVTHEQVEAHINLSRDLRNKA
jgi:hypothetical protein